MKTSNLSLCGVSALVLSTAFATAADAQTAVLEEMTVTAQKRETALQDTALSISVIDSAALGEQGIKDLRDLVPHTPGVALAAEGISTIVTIRGVSSRDATEIGDPAVAISLDGFYYQRIKGLNDAMFDLERVEIMRGPQGTLYGRNATAGAINFVTAKPTDELEGKLSLGLGNYNAVTTEGMINIPLTETLKLRTAFATNNRDGYRENEAPAVAGDDAGSSAARVHLAWEPTDELSMLLTGQYSTIDAVGPTYSGYLLGDEGIVNDRYPASLDSDGTAHGLPSQRLNSETKGVQLLTSYSFDMAELTYLTGFREQTIQHSRDLDGTDELDYYFYTDEIVKDLTHEIRLTSLDTEKFDWMFGGFYFKSRNDLSSLFQDWSAENAPLNLYQFIYPDIMAESKSGFAQFGYFFTDALKVEIGGRYSEDYKHRRGYVNYGGDDNPVDANSSSNKSTYSFALNYDLTDDSMLYLKHGTGYKAGGFTSVSEYDPETISAWEIGSKNRFLDNRFELNLTAFYYDYKDQQISQFRDSVTTTFNAGKSEIWGAEVEWTALVGEHGMFTGFLSYLDAEFTEFCTSETNGVCAEGADWSGNVPPQSPEYQLMLAYEHQFPLSSGYLTARVQTRYESETYLVYTNYEREKQDGYSKSDLMLTYTDNSEDWSIQGYIRNLEDETTIQSAGVDTLWQAYNYTLAPPRTFGVKLDIHW